jgi:hypothetical protein
LTRERALLLLAEATVSAARAAIRVIPAPVKKRIDDGIFHYIFQKTRVENDAYGWRPTTPPGGSGAPVGDPPKAGPG